MITNNSFKANKTSWTSLPSGFEVKLYKSNDRILIYRHVVLTSWNKEIIRRYGYGLRPDDCTHTKRFVYNAVKHYLYVKEMLYGD